MEQELKWRISYTLAREQIMGLSIMLKLSPFLLLEDCTNPCPIRRLYSTKIRSMRKDAWYFPLIIRC